MIRAWIFIVSVLLYATTSIQAQIATVDYLTYSDRNPETSFPMNKLKITCYIFKRLKEFDKNGNAITREEMYDSPEYYTFSVWYLNFAYKLYNGKNIKIATAIHGWAAFSKRELGFGTGWGTSWLWANLKSPIHAPLWVRIGYKFGKTGDSFRVDDNQWDIGLLYGIRIGSLNLESTVSYRIRSRAKETEALPDVEFVPIGETTGLYDQAGNEIHYKIEPDLKLSQNMNFSLLLQGYCSGNKKFHGKLLSESQANKTAFGGNLYFRRKAGSVITLGFLWDLWGRYEEKGFTIVFNIGH